MASVLVPDDPSSFWSRRRASILHDVNVPGCRALEIGPLHRALLNKNEGSVFFADHLSTEDLIKKYSNNLSVPASHITPVDFVIDSHGLKHAVKDYAPFDIVVASHVMEHVPNLVGWLEDVYEILVDGGRLCLALPDKRYTFDVMRRSTFLKDALEAATEQRTRPSIELVCDAYRSSTGVTADQLWANINLADLTVGHSLESQRNAIERHLAG